MADTQTLTRNVTLKIIECGTCGVPFALPQTLWQSCYDDGGFFYCPMGHSRGWTEANSKSSQDKLRAKLAQTESQLEYARQCTDRAKRETAAAKGQLTKERNRTKNGVCPCCNRSFQNLKRHIASQHPTFTAEEAAA